MKERYSGIARETSPNPLARSSSKPSLRWNRVAEISPDRSIPDGRDPRGQERHRVLRHPLHGVVRPGNLLEVLVPHDRERMFRVRPVADTNPSDRAWRAARSALLSTRSR